MIDLLCIALKEREAEGHFPLAIYGDMGQKADFLYVSPILWNPMLPFAWLIG